MSTSNRQRRARSNRFGIGTATSRSQHAEIRRTTEPQPFTSQIRNDAVHDTVPSSTDNNLTLFSSQALIDVHSDISCDADKDESLDHIIMASDKVGKGVVGCAYYVAREERLFCMEDMADSTEDIVETLILEIQPTVLLLSSRFENKNSMNIVNHNTEGLYAVHREDRKILPYKLERRPNSDYHYESALRKLSSLQLSQSNVNVRYLVPGDNSELDQIPIFDEIGLTDQAGRVLYTAGLLNLDSSVSIGCAGAVISCLQRKRTSEYLQDDPRAQIVYKIEKVDMFSLKDSMLTSADTIASLQIMQPEFHPNTANQGPGAYGAKESLSLFGLFHHLARSPQGKARLRQLFLRPSIEKRTIELRLDFISCFTRSENEFVLQNLSKSMSKVKNMRKTVTFLARGIEGNNRNTGKIKSGIWSSLLEFCYHAIEISETLHEAVGSDRLSICVKAQNILDKPLFQRIGRMIHEVVDLEKTMESHRTVVKRNVNPELDQIKDVYENIEEILSEIAKQITDRLPTSVLNPNLSVIYMPQLGFLISIPCIAGTGQPEYDVGDPSWEMIFHARDRAFFKDDEMRLMDEKLGDLYVDICDIEIEIAYELAQRVLQHREMLVTASDICGELDSLLALSHGAVQHMLIRPEILEQNVISIRGGRHLLQEMTVESFVANDSLLVGGQESRISSMSNGPPGCEDLTGPNMILLTGPNYSGKSVYQKQVALIAYLAQVGSFVPAESASIGITDKILTRITTRETVSKGQSAFMIDLQQISRALNSFTARSLLILDEFGKGTDSCDGAGLMAGVLEYLLTLGKESPKVLASTHFHEIFEHGRFDNYPNLALAHMEVIVDHKRKADAPEPNDEVRYLYSLKSGRSSLSYGIQCAVLNGIPNTVVQRAQQLSDLAIQGEDLTMACSSVSVGEAEELERAEIIAREFLRHRFGSDQEADGPQEITIKELLDACLEVKSC